MEEKPQPVVKIEVDESGIQSGVWFDDIDMNRYLSGYQYTWLTRPESIARGGGL